jgi:hypothetical protein
VLLRLIELRPDPPLRGVQRVFAGDSGNPYYR